MWLGMSRSSKISGLPKQTQLWLALSGTLLVTACQREAPPEPVFEREESKLAQEDTQPAPKSAPALAEPVTASDTKPVVKAAPGDPERGNFTLEEATAGLPGSGTLVAEIQTDLGTLTCDLFEDKAPITVANFVGLARGTRAWNDNGKWVKKPLYDGTVFHRVIRGFMLQGGDPKGNGSGGPGYEIPDEVWEGATHDRRGLLCMANRGPNTNGSQFFIMDGAAKHLDGGYTIFGQCGPESLIEKLAGVEVRGDRAVNPTKIKTVKIQRKK